MISVQPKMVCQQAVKNLWVTSLEVLTMTESIKTILTTLKINHKRHTEQEVYRMFFLQR